MNMLNELELELFKILDSELNKKLLKWCYINDESWVYIIWDENCTHKLGDRYITIYEHKIPKVKYLKIQNPNDYSQYIPNPTFDILWHYPTTNNILMYCINKASLWFHNNNWVNTCIYFDIKQEPYLYRLDITKEIINYTDEQKQELYDFLKTL
jgi:hypothetical protein